MLTNFEDFDFGFHKLEVLVVHVLFAHNLDRNFPSGGLVDAEADKTEFSIAQFFLKIRQVVYFDIVYIGKVGVTDCPSDIFEPVVVFFLVVHIVEP